MNPFYGFVVAVFTFARIVSNILLTENMRPGGALYK